MASNRINRINEEIQKELSNLLRTVKDPRVQGKLLTVVRIELANDLSFGKVYISALEGYDTAVNAVKGLQHAQGLIRREVANRLRLRKSPELKFIADDSVRKGIELWQEFESKTRKDKNDEDN